MKEPFLERNIAILMIAIFYLTRLYKNLINMTFKIALRKYFIIFKVFRCENFEAFVTTIYNNFLT